MADRRLNPFQPSTSPWDQSFTAGGSKGTILFPSAVAPYANPLVPIATQKNLNIAGANNPPIAPGILTPNLLSYTQDFGNAVWGVSNAALTGDYVQAPDGTFTAGYLLASAADGCTTQSPIPFDISTRATVSVYMKHGNTSGSGGNVSQFGIYDNAAGVFIMRAQVSWTGDVATGLATAGGGGASYVISDVGGGWYRLSGVTNGNCTAANTNTFIIYAKGAGIGQAGNSVYIWGAQVESGTGLSQYGAVAASRR